ncbi:hypothetical protein ICW40_16145, partial [Actinotalea ferrariae]|uniref:LamG-like jellyroll fold domain-containing protein n=1 Tax=Actinotalea ferrariae TaxID=1386098 RepID=UPI001C8C28CF
MRTSSTDRRARSGALVLLAAAVVGAVAGTALPRLGSTAALLTDDATVTSAVDVVPCDPAAWEDAVAALDPVLRWRLDAPDLRPDDVAAPALPECDVTGGGWDLDPTTAGATSGELGLTTPEDLTVALWVGTTAGAATEGTLLELRGEEREVRVVVVPGGGLEVRYGGPDGPVTVAAPPLTGDAQLLALVVGADGVRLAVDGEGVAAGPAEAGPASPLVLTVAAATGASADVVVDDVLVLDAPLAAGTLTALAAAG